MQTTLKDLSDSAPMLKKRPGFIALAILMFAFSLNVSAARLQSKKPGATSAIQNKLNEYVDRISALGFTGQLLVAEKGKVIIQKNCGLADRKSAIPTSGDTLFNIASLTKQFTAAAILRLEMEDKLRVTEPIGKYLEGVPADKVSITIHQLLTHTAGLRRDFVGQSRTLLLTREETVKKIFDSPLQAKPSARFAYSNDGYRLLAAIIEKVSQQSYQNYVRQYLFKPAGMRHTGVFLDSNWQNGRIAHGFNEWQEMAAFSKWTKSWHHIGSGGIVSTANDLHKWMLALRSQTVLSREQRDKFFARHAAINDTEFYGYGWFIGKTKDHKALLFHGGDNPGYHSELRWYREDDRLIIILTNRDYFGLDGGAIHKRIVATNLSRILSGDSPEELPQVTKATVNNLQRFVGAYSLPSGATLNIWLDADRLMLGATGQEAINLVAYPERDADTWHRAVSTHTSNILRAVTTGKVEQAKTEVSADAYKFYIPFLAEQFEAFEKQQGELKETINVGTISLPWDEKALRVYVRLRFEQGDSRLFLGWEDNDLNDVTTGDERPFPIILFLAPQTKTDFVGCDLVTFKSLPMSFNIDDRGRVKGLTLRNKTGEVTAIKAN